jgi:hypothetical protein
MPLLSLANSPFAISITAKGYFTLCPSLHRAPYPAASHEIQTITKLLYFYALIAFLKKSLWARKKYLPKYIKRL